ncbi:MAG: prephenate dehydrogenase [Lachnospiraceae bacterium]
MSNVAALLKRRHHKYHIRRYNFMTLGFIGFGLIGGSIARRIKKIHPDYQIMAYARTRSTLEQAAADGNIDIILDRVDEKLADCDIIFLCTPVSYNAYYLNLLKPIVKEGTLLTDVGSTKTNIHEEIIRLDMEKYFIGGHPMTGSERTGYQNSTDHLLENAYYVLTPTTQSTQAQLDLMLMMVRDLKAIPLILDYHKHDYSVAGISHLPHIVAASLVNLVKDSDSEDQVMRRIAAGGFKDITRIASSSPIMWEQICMTNRDNLGDLLEDYIASLQHTLTDIRSGNGAAIHQLFEESGAYRSSIPERSKGALPPQYSIFLDIEDRPGAIAAISSFLAYHEVSIKNIGISNNRLSDPGVLKIEFYDEASRIKAMDILKQHNHSVYLP